MEADESVRFRFNQESNVHGPAANRPCHDVARALLRAASALVPTLVSAQPFR